MYPVMLSLTDQPCLVVGGGGVALRKVLGLLEEGARVTVVAPDPVGRIIALAAEGRLTLERRAYRSPEAGDYRLVLAATDARETNRLVAEDARAAGVWVNVADDPELCDFHLPARVRRGDLQLTVASAGRAPFAVRLIRRLLERRFGEEWIEWTEAAAGFRRRVRALGLDAAEERRCFEAWFEATVDPERLTARVPRAEEESACLIRRGRVPSSTGARDCATAPRDVDASLRREGTGWVSLVGAGTGAPDLLTLRGYRRLHEADAIVYDRLAAGALPADLPSRVELHPVGKTAGRHPVPQQEITALLVRLASAGARVVRLKGGDPYVFGRGAEEAEELARRGIPFEVVPGVTAGIAGPAWAGIPVTCRSEAVRVTLVTAHECAKSGGPQVRWDLLAQDPHATIVGYMGVTALPGVVRQLLDAGMAPDTPAAMVERATTAAQRVAAAPLARLPDEARRVGIRPPAVFVIGPGVTHRKRLDWQARAVLAGQRLLLPPSLTRAEGDLSRAGAEVLVVPLPMTPAARIALAAAPVTGCVFATADDVDLVEDERANPGLAQAATAWCLGAGTARRARMRGWDRVIELAGTNLAEEIGDACMAARQPA
ncbi:MAG: siroheme synthase CysG [Acidobacteriota bacterium]